jgi:serine/threonine protein kinase
MAYMGGSALSASITDTRLLAGQILGGKYRVSHLLGEGGMASVWAGSNERTGKRVALKLIRPSFMATPGAEAFLHSEGLAASRVNHPNVVTVFDVIEHEGRACIVMELLDGVPFGTYISRNGQLTLRDALVLLLPAMRGVAAAHAQGVIHRDLKPQNIFVCVGPDGRVVTTKVLDFGIATMMDWARGTSTAAVPGLVGTPSYMSPEHIEGSDHLDGRTDVYGFGLLLYEAFTGQMAFPGEPGAELLRRVICEPAVPLRDLRPDLPMGIIGIVETAMAKHPDQRFATLDLMVSAIEDQVMPATPPPLLGTPASGVPSAAMGYSISGPLAFAVPIHIGREPSEQQFSTRIFGQPAKRDPDQGTSDAEAADERGRKDGDVTRAPAPITFEPGSGVASADAVMSGPSTERHRSGVGAAWRGLRGWRAVAGASLFVAIAIGGLTMVRARGRENSLPTTISAPIVHPSSVPAESAQRPTATVAGAAVAPTDDLRGGRADVGATPSPSSPLGAAQHPELLDQSDGAGGAGQDAFDLALVGNKPRAAQPPQSRKKRALSPDRASKHEVPRAGTLRVDDF